MAMPATTLNYTDDPPANIVAMPTPQADTDKDKERVLPLPGWLTRLYFIFPVILYIPDAIFNYYVYSDGGTAHNANPVLQAGFVVLWGFLAIGVVGMAYLLSVLAPWHWGQGHHVQAFFCAMGVVIATAITTWCSLAFRSQDFKAFPTDQWVYSIWPQLQQSKFSLTMLLVAIAPPFWGLFWAVVQPTTRRRSLAQMQMSHEERLLRTQQEAELKQIKAETNAKVREAQLRGMAATLAAGRKQAAQVLRGKSGEEQSEAQTETPAEMPAEVLLPVLPESVSEPIEEPTAESVTSAPMASVFAQPFSTGPITRGLPSHVVPPTTDFLSES